MTVTPRQPRNQSLVRGVGLLRALAGRPGGATVAELAEAVGIPRTTASRLLATLEELGVAERLPRSRGWIVGAELARLSREADPFARLRERARPVLETVSDEVRESAMVSVVHGNWETETVVQVDAPNLVGATNWLGQRFGGVLHASAVGKLALAQLTDDEIRARFASPLRALTPGTLTEADALIAHLHGVREQGYAATIDELETGLTAVAVPIDDEYTLRFSSARVLSVSISGPSARLTSDRYAELLAILRRSAGALASKG
jgi:DNA-binding IclR family transcriptional regulator